MWGEEVGRADSVLPAHLADHELRVATDEIGPFRTSFAIEVAQVLQQKDQAVVLCDIVAAHGTVGCSQIPYVTNEFLVSNHQGGFHGPLLLELIAGAGAVEETERPGPIGRWVRGDWGGVVRHLRIGRPPAETWVRFRRFAPQFAPR